MQLVALTALTMVAFAANSVLNRLALAGGHIDPVSFGTVRLAAGALTLALLCLVLRSGLKFGGRNRIAGVLSLAVYIYGFSIAYVVLDAGFGALVLFGTVQLTMFAAALWSGERPTSLRWVGTALAVAGLVWLLWPGGHVALPWLHVGCMIAAGIGWGVYSLAGRGAGDAMQSTAANFVLAAPIGVALGLLQPVAPDATPAALPGILLACLSGAVTSGLGYALWYTVLPRLSAAVAAVSQLTVPAIATLGGVVLLNEVLTLRIALATALILGGVALAVLAPKPQGTIRSRGS